MSTPPPTPVPGAVVRAVDALPGRIGVAVRTPAWSYGRHADRVLTAASVIKLFPLAALVADAEAGRRSYDERIMVTADAHVGGMGVLRHLGTTPVELSLWQLAVLMTVASDNTATNLVIDALGTARITTFTEEVGAGRTRTERRMYDLAARARGAENATTAADVLRLVAAIEDGALGRAGRERFRACLAGQQHHTKLTLAWSREERLLGGMGHKTGELAEVEHDVLVYDTTSGPVIAAVLLSDVTDGAAARQAHGALGRALFEAVPPTTA